MSFKIVSLFVALILWISILGRRDFVSTKEVEVQTAKKEAERIAALNANAGAIGYMNAMANLKIAEGVANGKVQSIVVPYDFKGIVNAK